MTMTKETRSCYHLAICLNLSCSFQGQYFQHGHNYLSILLYSICHPYFISRIQREQKSKL